MLNVSDAIQPDRQLAAFPRVLSRAIGGDDASRWLASHYGDRRSLRQIAIDEGRPTSTVVVTVRRAANALTALDLWPDGWPQPKPAAMSATQTG